MYHFGVHIWEVFHEIFGPLFYYLEKRWKKKALKLNYKAEVLNWSCFMQEKQTKKKTSTKWGHYLTRLRSSVQSSNSQHHSNKHVNTDSEVCLHFDTGPVVKFPTKVNRLIESLWTFFDIFSSQGEA